jgi:demethylmenaquinone methyltransferase/2-methoxy-6-polyprenyl-1,4-benzoquinol methylase
VYDTHAGYYDHATSGFNWLRRQTVSRLGLRPGSTVIDAGCGTGLCFPFIEEAIGPDGRVIAVEPSGPMLEKALSTARRHGWRNITAVRGSAEEAPIPKGADAVLFCAVHDILRSERGLRNVLRRAAPGARVVASGGRWAPGPLSLLNPFVAATHSLYVSSFEGFDRPWSLLARFCDLRVETVAFGTGFVASGRLREGALPAGRPATPPAAPRRRDQAGPGGARPR